MEKGETGNLHWQVFMQLKKPMTRKALKELLVRPHLKRTESGDIPHHNAHTTISKMWNTIHLESREGTQGHSAKACWLYCRKEETAVNHPKCPRFDFGKLQVIEQARATIGGGGGARKELGSFIESIGDMQDMGQIFESETAIQVQAAKAFAFTKAKIEHQNRKATPMWRDIKIHILWGDTGTGKTRKAMERAMESDDMPYLMSLEKGQPIWWDGYDNQKVVILDEFDGQSQIGLSKLNRILDGYPLRLGVKGSHTFARFTEMYLTSNIDPKYWWTGSEERQTKAFWRRVSSCTGMFTPEDDDDAEPATKCNDMNCTDGSCSVCMPPHASDDEPVRSQPAARAAAAAPKKCPQCDKSSCNGRTGQAKHLKACERKQMQAGPMAHFFDGGATKGTSNFNGGQGPF